MPPRYRSNAEDMTGKYPDILARLPGLLAPGVDSVVIDAEAVGWDVEKKKILPFQVGPGRLVDPSYGLGPGLDVVCVQIHLQICLQIYVQVCMMGAMTRTYSV